MKQALFALFASLFFWGMLSGIIALAHLIVWIMGLYSYISIKYGNIGRFLFLSTAFMIAFVIMFSLFYFMPSMLQELRRLLKQ